MALTNGIFVHFVGNSLMRAMHQKFVLCMIIGRILFNQQFAMVSESWIHVTNCLLLIRTTYRDRGKRIARFFRFTFVSLSVSAFPIVPMLRTRIISIRIDARSRTISLPFLLPFQFFSFYLCISPLSKKGWAVAVFHPLLRQIFLFAHSPLRCPIIRALLSRREPTAFFPVFFFLPLKHFITPTNESWMGIKLLRILNYLTSQFPALSKPLFYLLPLFFFFFFFLI